MKTLNDIAGSIFLTFSNEPFKLFVKYYKNTWSDLEIFDSVSDDDKAWSAFRRIYGECRVTVLEIDFRQFKNGKSRIWLYLLGDDTMKIKAISEEADDETD